MFARVLADLGIKVYGLGYRWCADEILRWRLNGCLEHVFYGIYKCVSFGVCVL